jgi:hypothetical protein
MNKLLILIKSTKVYSEEIQMLKKTNKSHQKCLVCDGRVKVDKSLDKKFREKFIKTY